MAKNTKSGKSSRVARLANVVAGAVGVGVGIFAVRSFAGMAAQPLPAPTGGSSTAGTSRPSSSAVRRPTIAPQTDATTGQPDTVSTQDPSKVSCGAWLRMTSAQRTTFARQHLPLGTMTAAQKATSVTSACEAIRSSSPDMLDKTSVFQLA